MEIRQIQLSDAPLLSRFYLENEHLTSWEPRREHSLPAWNARLKQRVQETNQEKAVFFISIDSRSGDIKAVCNLTNIIREPFHACYMGFAVSKEHEGKGQMFELCNYVVDYAFKELQLNRVMANYMPKNSRSEKLLNRLGFEREGYAKKYLKINGQWEDHVLTSILNQYFEL